MAVTLEAVRRHCNIDDMSMDSVLEIYLAAAIEAAKQYATLDLGARIERHSELVPPSGVIRLRGVPSGPVSVAAIVAGRGQVPVRLRVDGRDLQILDMVDCSTEVALRYPVGDLSKGVSAAPLVELGILKFVAHAVGNRGDDPSCWAEDSGALACWKPYSSMVIK